MSNGRHDLTDLKILNTENGQLQWQKDYLGVNEKHLFGVPPLRAYLMLITADKFDDGVDFGWQNIQWGCKQGRSLFSLETW